ncbi:hypothetical protein OH809_14645 [Streptomyces sp. NBC_00873]|uniref:hypothetical protein n=1 Tax=unclassified Streptomyces TaxID=2593676 RepID=UPI00386B25ED|nr:hypothetical protein OH809_14645 [Streptomyces sp. NBC_00873]WTA46172.1 hypothetical protein OH821_29040 [Streptomyces sp. NBC_00842]
MRGASRPLVDVLASSENRIVDPKIRNAMKMDGSEILADVIPGDAEASALAHIKKMGWTPVARAANRPVCPCARTSCSNRSATPWALPALWGLTGRL